MKLYQLVARGTDWLAASASRRVHSRKVWPYEPGEAEKLEFKQILVEEQSGIPPALLDDEYLVIYPIELELVSGERGKGKE